MKVRRISPMLAVAEMATTIAFYREVLAFETMLETEEYSILERDGMTIHLMLAESPEVLRCVRGHTEIYVEVVGIAELWEHVQGFRERYRMRELFAREYGMTEFHVEDPNGCLVFVGERSLLMEG